MSEPTNPVLDARDVSDAIGRRVTPAGEYLGAMLGEGFWSSIPGQVVAGARAGRPEVTDQEIQEAAGVRGAGRLAPEPLAEGVLDEDQWKASGHWREGLAWDRGMTPARAAALAEIHDENSFRRWLIAQRRAGVGGTVAGFAAAMVGSLPDPVNFIPFAGPAFRAAAIARAGAIGGRALVASGEAAIGTAISSPLVAAGRAAFGDDVGFADVLTDIALGAAVGFGFGGALGVAARLRGGWRDGTAPPVDLPLQEAARRALSEGAADLAAGRPIDVDPGPTLAVQQRAAPDMAAIAARLDAEPRSDAPLTVLPEPGRRTGPEPSLLELLAERGLRDEGGELAAMNAELWHRGQPGRRRLVRDDGLPLDQAREMAAELGYIGRGAGDEGTTTVSDLIEAIRGELAGARVFPAGSEAAERAALQQAAARDRAAMVQAAEERGIAHRGVSDDALRERLLDHDDAIARRQDKAERAARLAEQRGEAPPVRATAPEDDIPFDMVFRDPPDPRAETAIAAAAEDAARPARTLEERMRAAGLDPDDVAQAAADLEAIAARLTPEDKAAIAAADEAAEQLERTAAALERAAACPF